MSSRRLTSSTELKWTHLETSSLAIISSCSSLSPKTSKVTERVRHQWRLSNPPPPQVDDAVPVDGGDGDEKGNESDEEENIKVKPKAFTELDRLAYVVRAIENDCAVVPVGAFKLTPTHELRHNDSFRGVSLADIANPASFQHFRAPQSEEKKKFIARDDALFHFNFLDPISNDLPKGCWSIQTDSSKTSATVRSLLWPGFVGYHRANSQIFGYAYIGTGIKNSDLPFLL